MQVEVDVIDDLSTGKVEQLAGPVTFFEADIAKVVPTSYVNGYDTVFHLAAKARIQPSIEDPVAFDLANLHGTVVALDIARRNNAKFIFSSSSSVYGPQKEMPEHTEMTPDPQNPYALQKLLAEAYCRHFERFYDVKTTIFRYFNVFGERQVDSGAYATVIGIFMKQVREGKVLTIVGDGEQRRDFTYVGDVVEANILAAQSDMAGVFNVGTGKNYSVNQIANAVAGKEYKRNTGIERTGEVQETLADSAPLQKLGWKATVNVLDWIKQNK